MAQGWKDTYSGKTMNCPKCSASMVEEQLQRVTADRCSGCGGLWIDHTALEVILDKAGGLRSLGQALDLMDTTGSSKTSMDCPRCASSRLLAHVQDGIETEWCKQCRGLYLDREELESLIAWRKARISEDNVHKRRKDSEGLYHVFVELGDILNIFM